jgi:hypothetical protein
MATVKVVTKGPLFDQARREGVLNKGIANGTKKLLPKVQQVVQAKLDKSLAPPEESGRFRRSIITQMYPSGTGVVKSNDRRKIRTWLETRRRGDSRRGQAVNKLGRGAYMFRAGKTFAKNEQKRGYYEEEIAKALNG